MIADYCRKCGGEGRVRVRKNMKVKIPAGVNGGSTLRVRGEGDAGPRGYFATFHGLHTFTDLVHSYNYDLFDQGWM